jgi:[ribosomal protein S5]-alanine N-acetyltransferase
MHTNRDDDITESTPDIRRPTKRLDLVAATVDHLRAELASPEQLGRLLDAEVPEGWPPGEYDEPAQRFFLERMSEGGADVVGWYGWYALLRSDSRRAGVLIAAGGFLGLPNETGTVEIGYSVHPEWRGQGYATEMVDELMKYAFEDERTRRIIAHTSLQNPESCKILDRAGFRECRRDPETLVIEFELLRAEFKEGIGS